MPKSLFFNIFLKCFNCSNIFPTLAKCMEANPDLQNQVEIVHLYHYISMNSAFTLVPAKEFFFPGSFPQLAKHNLPVRPPAPSSVPPHPVTRSMVGVISKINGESDTKSWLQGFTMQRKRRPNEERTLEDRTTIFAHAQNARSMETLTRNHGCRDSKCRRKEGRTRR